jgi:hypothetical protein
MILDQLRFMWRKLDLCHYQTTDSLECHYKNMLRYYVIFKHWITDKMPFRGLFNKVSTDWTILPLNSVSRCFSRLFSGCSRFLSPLCSSPPPLLLSHGEHQASSSTHEATWCQNRSAGREKNDQLLAGKKRMAGREKRTAY